MLNYIIACRGGKEFENPEESAEHKQRFGAWLGGPGEAVIKPGTPFGKAIRVSASGVTDENSPDRLIGYPAVEMAKTCPFLDVGTIVVAEMMEI